MSCCNRKREMLAEASATMPAPVDIPAPDVAPRARRADPVRLRYTMTLPITIRGSASGREYQFSSQRSIQMVDPRDAAELLQSRMFRQFA